MAITQQEIADRLGVSRQLVTHALNGAGTISQQKRREVLEAAEKMGYRRNELARAIATGKSRILGIVTNNPITENMARTIAGGLEEAAARGYSTKLLFLHFDEIENDSHRIVKICASWQLEGVVVVGLSDAHMDFLRDLMAQAKIPIAFAGIHPPEGAIGAYSDDSDAWNLAVQHLFDLGHRRIAHLSGRPTSKLACSRLELCLSTLQRFGLPVDEHSSTFSSWNNVDLMEQGVNRLLNVPSPPTAVLCAGDHIATVAVRVARSRGLRIPEDLSVVGFGDDIFCKFLDPPLTSISQPHEEVARQAISQLLMQVESNSSTVTPYRQDRKLVSGCKLVVRSSTGPPAFKRRLD